MKLEVMLQNEIYSTVDFCYLHELYQLQIILTDGTILYGSIPVKCWTISSSNPMPSKERCFKGDCLELYYAKIFNEHSVYIPLNMISGISVIDYEQEQIEVSSDSNLIVRTSVYDLMFEDLSEKAEKLSLLKKRHFLMYSLRTTKPFVWGNLSLKGEGALYVDWVYLEKISGGVNSLGAGVGIVSLSAGWNKSLWSVFENLVKQKPITMEALNKQEEGVIKGYISFIERYDLPLFEKVVDKMEMEGSLWIPAIISEKQLRNIDDLRNTNWCIAYFKEEGMMLPQKAWEGIKDKLNIYGEIIPIPIITEFGESECFIKVRCAAWKNE